MSLHRQKLTTILTHFWKKWQVNLRESYKISREGRNKPIISVSDVVIEERNLLLSNWKLARVHEFFQGSDGNVRGALA